MTRPVLRRVALSTGVVLTLLGTAAVVLYAVPSLQVLHPFLVVVSSFIPYGALAWLGASVLLLSAARGWTKALSLVAILGLVVQVWWARPYWPIGSPDPTGMTVVTVNLRCDSRGIADLAALVASATPDVVVLQGFYDSNLPRLGADWDRMLPHHTFHPMSHLPECGTFVFARTPLTNLTLDDAQQPAVSVIIASGTPLVILPVDVPTPTKGIQPWLDAFARLATTASTHRPARIVAAGDFNAVLEHAPMRSLLADAVLRDAAEVAVAGWTPTFPADQWYPPLTTLDHVLIGPGLTAAAVRTEDLRGQAHRALVVRLGVE